MGLLDGKVAFVTGAANGIGRAAALAFAHEGANVALADLSEQGIQETARMIEGAGGRTLAVRCEEVFTIAPPPCFSAGQAAYCAAKFGIVGLTKAAALDYASSNIRINAVCPGIISTPMMDRFSGGTPEGRERVIAQEPVGRMGKPEEIAAAVVWLCSDPAAFVVGHAMVIDGGQTV